MPINAYARLHPQHSPASLPPSCVGMSPPEHKQWSPCSTRLGAHSRCCPLPERKGEKRNTACSTATYFAFS